MSTGELHELVYVPHRPIDFDFEWAELPDDIAHRKHDAWQQWELIDHQLHDPARPLAPEEVEELERQQRAAWKQYWHADGARYHLSNRQMSDAITVMERAGMARQVPVPPFVRGQVLMSVLVRVHMSVAGQA